MIYNDIDLTCPPLTSTRNMNGKGARMENESSIRRAMDSRRMVEQRGPFPSSQMRPQHERYQNILSSQPESHLQSLHVLNAPTKTKMGQNQNSNQNQADQRKPSRRTNGREGSEDSRLNDLIFSIKKQQQKRSIRLQSQIHD